MPELQNDSEVEKEGHASKILQFFSVAVKDTRKEKIKPLSKVVIRRLPPKMTKEEFLESFPLPPHDYFYFVRGDLFLGKHSFSRAYVNITNPDDIYAFQEKFDDYPLQDTLGKEYHAVVEWAPVQRIPKKSPSKKSSKAGTIESDPKYLEFLEKLENEKNNPATNTSEYFMETDCVNIKENKATTTPLLEFLKLKKQQKIDIRNENRIRKRDAEKEKRRKEDDMRRSEKIRREKEKHRKDDEKFEEAKDAKTTPVEDGKKIEIKSKLTEKETKIIKEEKSEQRRSLRKSESSESSPKGKANPRDIVKPKETKAKEDKPVANTPEPKSSTAKTQELKKVPPRTEPKSKFRYSEQRNRDRNQKAPVTTGKKSEEPEPIIKEEHKKEVKDGQMSRQSTQDTSDGSVDDGDDSKSKDPRTERKIRNKDRPTMQIYRPGMGKFSKQRIETQKDETDVVDAKKEIPETKENLTVKSERIKDDEIRPFRNRKILDNTHLRGGNKTCVVPKGEENAESSKEPVAKGGQTTENNSEKTLEDKTNNKVLKEQDEKLGGNEEKLEASDNTKKPISQKNTEKLGNYLENTKCEEPGNTAKQFLKENDEKLAENQEKSTPEVSENTAKQILEEIYKKSAETQENLKSVGSESIENIKVEESLEHTTSKNEKAEKETPVDNCKFGESAGQRVDLVASAEETETTIEKCDEVELSELVEGRADLENEVD